MMQKYKNGEKIIAEKSSFLTILLKKIQLN